MLSLVTLMCVYVKKLFCGQVCTAQYIQNAHGLLIPGPKFRDCGRHGYRVNLHKPTSAVVQVSDTVGVRVLDTRQKM